MSWGHLCVWSVHGRGPPTAQQGLSFFESEEKVLCCGSGLLLSSKTQGVKQEDCPETELKRETLPGAQSWADTVPITQVRNKGEATQSAVPLPRTPKPLTQGQTTRV